jgi:hypothetical protein
MSEDYEVLIVSGITGQRVTEKDSFIFPFLQETAIFNRRLIGELTGGIEAGLISGDGFFLDFHLSFEAIVKRDDEVILDLANQGEHALEMLKLTILGILIELVKSLTFEEILRTLEPLRFDVASIAISSDFKSLTISKLSFSRIPLDSYDLGNIVHFKLAKEIVTRIARAQFRDIEFIDASRKTIGSFEIVDEE